MVAYAFILAIAAVIFWTKLFVLTFFPILAAVGLYFLLRSFQRQSLSLLIATFCGLLLCSFYLFFGLWPSFTRGIARLADRYEQPLLCSFLHDSKTMLYAGTEPSKTECLNRLPPSSRIHSCTGYYCFEHLFQGTGLDNSYCALQENGQRDMCYMAYVNVGPLENIHQSLCNKISRNYMHNDCLSTVARRTLDPGLCKQQRNISLFEQCYAVMQEKIDLHGMAETMCPQQEASRQEWCYFWFAVQLKDSSLCEQINLPQSRRECLTEVDRPS